MSEFETFAVVLSFILGLGVAQILSSAVYLLQSRREITLRWTPLLWAYAPGIFEVYGFFLVSGFQVPALSLLSSMEFLMPLLIAIIALLCSEWALRKRKGLV